MQGRYADAWTDARTAEAAALEQHKVERSYRQMLAMTDDLLGALEQRNLRGQEELDDVVRRDITRTLCQLPPEAQRRFPITGTVQGALDGIFAVQEELLLVLQRMLHWDRLMTTMWEHQAMDESASRRSA